MMLTMFGYTKRDDAMLGISNDVQLDVEQCSYM